MSVYMYVFVYGYVLMHDPIRKKRVRISIQNRIRARTLWKHHLQPSRFLTYTCSYPYPYKWKLSFNIILSHTSGSLILFVCSQNVCGEWGCYESLLI